MESCHSPEMVSLHPPPVNRRFGRHWNRGLPSSFRTNCGLSCHILPACISYSSGLARLWTSVYPCSVTCLSYRHLCSQCSTETILHVDHDFYFCWNGQLIDRSLWRENDLNLINQTYFSKKEIKFLYHMSSFHM